MGRELFRGAEYCLMVHSDQDGDCLLLAETLPPEEGQARGSYGRTILVNLSALFAIGPLKVGHDGRVSYGERVVIHLPASAEGVFPFFRVSERFDLFHRKFRVAGFDALVRGRYVLSDIQHLAAHDPDPVAKLRERFAKLDLSVSS